MESSRLSCGYSSSVVTPLLLFEYSSAESALMLPLTFLVFRGCTGGVLAASDSELIVFLLVLLLLLLLLMVAEVAAVEAAELRGR